MAGPYGIYNGMPGAGEAFLLEGNKAADIFNTNLSNQQKQARMEALQRQKMQAEQQQNITNNLSKISPGEYWMNHDKEIKSGYSKLMDYGTELKSRNTDPFADKEFLRMREDLMANAKFSKQLQDEYKVVADAIQKNPNGFENLDEVLSYYSPERSLAEYKQGGYQRPALNRAYTLADAIRASDGKVSYIKENDGFTDTTKINKSGIIDQAISSTDTPEAKYLIKKSGGDEQYYTKGFPVGNGKGGRIWSTDEKKVDDIAVNYLSQDPTFPKFLEHKGYDISSQEKVLSAAKDFITKQNKAIGSYVDNYTNTVSGTGTTDYTKVFTAEANNRANKSEARAARKEAKDNEENGVIIGNQNSYVPVLKKGGAGVEKEKGSSLFSMNFNNSEVTVQPSRVVNQSKGTSSANTEAFSMKAGGVKLVPVFKNVGDEFNDLELSDRQLNEIITGNSKNKDLSLDKITFKPMVYGTRTIKDRQGNSSEESLSIPYDAITGNKQFKTANFDKQFSQFQELVNSEEFQALTTEEKFDFIKQNYNIK